MAGITSLLWLIVWWLRLDFHAAVFAGFIPARIGGMVADGGLMPAFLTPLSATLVHGGFVHLAFNMVILLFCGRAVEAVTGMWGMAILYVVGAYVAAAAHYLVSAGDIIPMVGASGAISAVLGAYAMLFGRTRVRVADPRLALWLNALWLMAAWIVLQLILGLTFSGSGIRIAIAAHIGGFVAGLLLARPLLMVRYRRA